MMDLSLRPKAEREVQMPTLAAEDSKTLEKNVKTLGLTKTRMLRRRTMHSLVSIRMMMAVKMPKRLLEKGIKALLTKLVKAVSQPQKLASERLSHAPPNSLKLNSNKQPLTMGTKTGNQRQASRWRAPLSSTTKTKDHSRQCSQSLVIGHLISVSRFLP